MEIAQTGLQLRPFHTSGQPVVFVKYQAQQAAHDFLEIAMSDDRGIGIMYGPRSSGKKTLVYQFLRGLPADLSVAVVDGARMKTIELLHAILAHFGLGIALNTVDEYWSVTRRFLAERARLGQTPILVLENITQMFPSALYALCKLAELKVEREHALRMILMDSKAPHSLIHSPSMSALSSRAIGAFELGPMTQPETSRYLFAKLYASGCTVPESILPLNVRDDIHAASDGWPGRVDSLVIKALERAQTLPLKPTDLVPRLRQPVPPLPVLAAVVDTDEHPDMRRLIVTLNGKTLQEIDVDDTKVLIGRSELCDVVINSRFISKYHALMIRTESGLHILDLHSSNGTFVNSELIQHMVLQHDDVISIGNHGVKLKFPAYRVRPVATERNLDETATMKSLEHLRSLKDEVDEILSNTSKRQG